jgi:hypothetical protein
MKIKLILSCRVLCRYPCFLTIIGTNDNHIDKKFALAENIATTIFKRQHYTVMIGSLEMHFSGTQNFHFNNLIFRNFPKNFPEFLNRKAFKISNRNCAHFFPPFFRSKCCYSLECLNSTKTQHRHHRGTHKKIHFFTTFFSEEKK